MYRFHQQHLQLQLIQDTVWADNIQCFMIDYPEFMPYINRIPLSSNYPIPYTNVNTLFQAIVHYICAVGVRYDYALRQWNYIFPFINTTNWTSIMESLHALKNDTFIQPKKRDMYFNLCTVMHENNLTHHTIQPHDIQLLKQHIKGIGDGCVAWIKKYFTTDDDCVEYTDIAFKKGFQHIYGSESISLRKHKAKEWISKGYGRIANFMILSAN